MSKPNGVVLYEGPSVLTGEPIVCILTGLNRPSQNPKTGPMLQTWILRADKPPTEAVQDGSDVAICGDCPLRGGFSERKCYVNVPQGPQAVWKAWKRGAYPLLVQNLADYFSDRMDAVRGKAVRFGSYGDPAAVPEVIWHHLSVLSDRHTGYTHQWRHENFDPRILELCMASVETQADIEELQQRYPGARYFRVRLPGEEKGAREVQCPASEEGGKRTTCYRCGLCNGGQKGRSISIEAHGAFVKRNWK